MRYSVTYCLSNEMIQSLTIAVLDLTRYPQEDIPMFSDAIV